MKKIISILLLVGTVILLFGCGNLNERKEDQTSNSVENAKIMVTILNKVNMADIWIIPDTEENRNTTVWGAAKLPKLDVETSQNAFISETSETNGLYLLRMIDEGEMFYSVDGIKLEHNQSIIICEDKESMATTLEVLNEDGTKISEYEMFVAMCIIKILLLSLFSDI